MEKIPFNRPWLTGREGEYCQQALQNGKLCGDGPFTEKCQALLEEKLQAKKILLTTSCTSALEMAALLIDLQPGDEVILPSYTFVSTANAFVLRGASLVFADVCPDTLNIDVEHVRSLVTERTKAIVPVHYAGVACDMAALKAIADEFDIAIIEDAAQGVGSTYDGQALGTIGQLGAFSFHETKNFVAGEGGAILINDESMMERAEVLREKGTNRSQFIRGEVDKYTWMDVGSSYLPSDILAAVLLAQLEVMDEITVRREMVYKAYAAGLADLAGQGRLALPHIPDNCVSNYHLFHMILDDEATRFALAAHLKQQEIYAVWHYVPLHSSPMGQKLGTDKAHLPVTDSMSSRLLRLPLYAGMSHDDAQRVVDAVGDFFKG